MARIPCWNCGSEGPLPRNCSFCRAHRNRRIWSTVAFASAVSIVVALFAVTAMDSKPAAYDPPAVPLTQAERP
jgi:hypothetical protein